MYFNKKFCNSNQYFPVHLVASKWHSDREANNRQKDV